MSKRSDEVARTILDYLQGHPKAGDTLEGISHWWFRSKQRQVPIEAIHAALRALAHKGVLEESKARDGSPIYFLAKSPSRRR